MTRREALRLLSLGATAALADACQALGPTPPAPAAASARLATPAPPTPVPPTPVPTPTPAPTGVVANAGLSVAIDLDPDTLDPAGQTNPTTASIVDCIAETLVRLQPDGSIGAGLAQRWDQSSDGRTLTFQLRPGITFHDGAALTGEAVRLSLARFLNPQLRVPLRAPFDSTLVSSIAATGPLGVRITLRESSRLFLQKLAATELAIVSPHHARAFPDTFNEEPIGTGPYRFKERRKGESVVVERYEGYWGKHPYFTQLQFRIVPEVATRESLLLAGQVDMLIQPPPSDLPTLQKSPGLKVLLQPTSRSTFVAMDLTLPGGTPLGIKKVRQALNYAVDRDGIIRNVLFGAATPMDAPLASALAGYARTGPYPFDPGRARQLLLEGGTPRLQLKFLHPTGRAAPDPQAAQVAQALAGNLHDVGVDTELIGADWPTFLAAISVPEDKGSAHMHLFNWSPALLDASQQLVQFVRGQWPPQGMATSHFTHPRVEELVSAAAHEPDDRKRSDEYAEAQRIIWDEAPWIFLWVPSFPIVHAATLKGISSLPNEKFSAVEAEPA